MQIEQSAISLDLEDVEDSSTLAKRHFGFTEAMSADSKHSAGAE
jgi:hypothetical protein